MNASDVSSRANEAAANFLESLDAPASKVEAAIIVNAYAAGWIQGAYAGANEPRQTVCKRRTSRRSASQCTTNTRG